MNHDDDLKERFRAADARLFVGEPPIGRIVGRGRKRRIRGIAATAIVAVSLGLALVLTLAVLLPIRPAGRTNVAPGGGTLRTSPVGLGVEVTYLSHWTLLLSSLGSSTDQATPVFQLTNYDPGVIGPDPQASWLCPLKEGELHLDGVLLVIQASQHQADGSLTPWPVSLSSQPSQDAFCGTGFTAAWEANGNTFQAFAALSPEATAEDRDALGAAFSSITFSSKLVDQAVAHQQTPAAVLDSIDAFGSSWNLVAFSQFHQGLSPGCLGVFGAGGGGGCFVKTDGTLDLTNPLFGDQDLVWSDSIDCQTAQYMLDGMVTSRAASVDVELLDGRTIPMRLADLPSSWHVPYHAWMGAVGNPPIGDVRYSYEGSVFRYAGRFVVRDATRNVITTVPFLSGC
jgi:hypothetical protein